MTTWIPYTPITHPWFAKPSMKRKFPTSASSSSTSPNQSDSDSALYSNGNPHRAKRRRCSTLERGFSQLSLDSGSYQHQRDSNVLSPGGGSGFVHTSPVSPDAPPSQLPDISEVSAPVYQGGYDMGDDYMQYDNLGVVKPAQVEEPFEPPHTPPIREINMKSSSWYEPEPDRIVVTDLDSSEDEADVEDNPIALPPSVLRHIAARNLGVLEKGGPLLSNSEDTSRALVLFRPLSLVPPKAEEDSDTEKGDIQPVAPISTDDDAMDVEP